MTRDLCPNCMALVVGHPRDECVLAALVQVLRERGELTEERLLEIHRNANVDAMWDDIGDVIDRLGAGEYNLENY